MKHYNSVFFVDKGETINVDVVRLDGNRDWPIIVRIEDSMASTGITLHCAEESQVELLKSSFSSAYDRLQAEVKDA